MNVPIDDDTEAALRHTEATDGQVGGMTPMQLVAWAIFRSFHDHPYRVRGCEPLGEGHALSVLKRRLGEYFADSD